MSAWFASWIFGCQNMPNKVGAWLASRVFPCQNRPKKVSACIASWVFGCQNGPKKVSAWRASRVFGCQNKPTKVSKNVEVYSPRPSPGVCGRNKTTISNGGILSLKVPDQVLPRCGLWSRSLYSWRAVSHHYSNCFGTSCGRKGQNRSVLIFAVYGHTGAHLEAVRRNLLELMLKHIGGDVGSRGATPAFTFGDFNNVWVAERFHIQTLLRANLFVDAKDWGSPSKHIQKNSHKRNESRIDLRLANRSGSMLLRAYAVCDGILPNDRSELHIDIDLPIGKLWKYIPVQPNLNYDILQEIQPKNCDPPIVDISAQLYLVLDQGKTDKAFPVWCLIAGGYFKQIPRTNQNHDTVYDTGSGWGQIRFQRQCMFPKQPNAQSFNLRARRICTSHSSRQGITPN